MKWLRKLWARVAAFFKRKPKQQDPDAGWGTPLRIQTLADPAEQAWVKLPGEPCKEGHELDGTDIREWRR